MLESLDGPVLVWAREGPSWRAGRPRVSVLLDLELMELSASGLHASQGETQTRSGSDWTQLYSARWKRSSFSISPSSSTGRSVIPVNIRRVKNPSQSEHTHPSPNTPWRENTASAGKETMENIFRSFSMLQHMGKTTVYPFWISNSKKERRKHVFFIPMWQQIWKGCSLCYPSHCTISYITKKQKKQNTELLNCGQELCEVTGWACAQAPLLFAGMQMCSGGQRESGSFRFLWSPEFQPNNLKLPTSHRSRQNGWTSRSGRASGEGEIVRLD